MITGAGLCIALACDLRVASENAFLTTAYRNRRVSNLPVRFLHPSCLCIACLWKDIRTGLAGTFNQLKGQRASLVVSR